MSGNRSTHFSRVTPIVGESLRRTRVALIGLPAAAPLVACLAACGVGRWLWADSGDGSDETLRTGLVAQHGPALGLDATTRPPAAWLDALRHDPPDLVVAVGGGARPALQAAAAARIPALFVSPPTHTSPCQAVSLFPGDDLTVVLDALSSPISRENTPPFSSRGEHPRVRTGLASVGRHLPGTARQGRWGVPYSSLQDVLSSPAPWDWLTVAPLCAGLARAMLLRGGAHQRADLEELWAAGARRLTVGAADHPLEVTWSPIHPAGKAPDRAPAAFRTPPARRGSLLIVGLGSLGSVAALPLAPHAAGLVIADPDRVDAHNPVRQAYPLAAVGEAKVQALGRTLQKAGAQNVIPLRTALSDERPVTELVERHDITAALVVTGTAADYAIARALRARDVPHVVGRCYPRARYWEAILVDGHRGPALGDLRGHLHLGPSPPLTPEQIAAYSDAGALEAEPATLIESGWAAAWMARLTAQFLAPAGLRERWFLELLASERVCLVGGVGVEPTPAGPAYHISRPGEIRAWARQEIRVEPARSDW